MEEEFKKFKEENPKSGISIEVFKQVLDYIKEKKEVDDLMQGIEGMGLSNGDESNEVPQQVPDQALEHVPVQVPEQVPEHLLEELHEDAMNQEMPESKHDERDKIDDMVRQASETTTGDSSETMTTENKKKNEPEEKQNQPERYMTNNMGAFTNWKKEIVPYLKEHSPVLVHLNDFCDTSLKEFDHYVKKAGYSVSAIAYLKKERSETEKENARERRRAKETQRENKRKRTERKEDKKNVKIKRMEENRIKKENKLKERSENLEANRKKQEKLKMDIENSKDNKEMKDLKIKLMKLEEKIKDEDSKLKVDIENEKKRLAEQDETVEKAQCDDEVEDVAEDGSDYDFDDDDEDWMERGAAILVRSNVGKTRFEFFDRSDLLEKQHYFAMAVVRDTVTEIYHVCCYIPHDRTLEAHRNLFGHINKYYAGQKVIVSGDFNCTLEQIYNVCVEVGVELEDRLYWKWATSIGTASPIPTKIDFVLTSKSVLVNVHQPSTQSLPGHSRIFWDRYSTNPVYAIVKSYTFSKYLRGENLTTLLYGAMINSPGTEVASHLTLSKKDENWIHAIILLLDHELDTTMRKQLADEEQGVKLEGLTESELNVLCQRHNDLIYNWRGNEKNRRKKTETPASSTTTPNTADIKKSPGSSKSAIGTPKGRPAGSRQKKKSITPVTAK
ncbi:hypothetical protein PFISCL1PPCAC_16864 [Pristionchus fissidentatus]|uniref:Endonuclease/exonuclease/phosphatase domain-containing protein n=1 Tax=Pristionchus fissidentatus TaxID=1538716 RepID=A0AAV5W156_9BILA|nr:hypothetical protein PFISCL1PPCAC_16864 [Pristionchus fissidentatus]